MSKLFEIGSKGQAPIRKLEIIIDVSHREELFDQLQRFATENRFRLLIRDVKVFPEGVFIELYRDDIQMLAWSDGDDPTLIDLGVYERDPAHATPAGTVDKLYIDLITFISEIPNVKVAEIK